MRHIAKAYYGPYAAKYDEGNGISNSNWTGGVSVCALRTEPLADLAVLTKQILSGTVDNASLRNSVFDYDKRSGFDGYQNGHVGYYDLVGMMRMITDDNAYEAWRQIFNSAIAYWATTPMNFSGVIQKMFSMEGTNGVSCYIPSTSNI